MTITIRHEEEKDYRIVEEIREKHFGIYISQEQSNIYLFTTLENILTLSPSCPSLLH